jgi:acetyl esterase/lipase
MIPSDALDRVDPELRGALAAYLALQPDESGVPVSERIAAFRARFALFAKPFLAQPSVQRRIIPGPVEAPDLVVFVINAGTPGANRPAILHMHGGGFIVGSAEASVADLQAQAAALDCVIVSVEYRLAPETLHPGALEDNHAALVWLHRQAEALGVDPTRIAVQGESAGGGHAAMLALAARDRGEAPIVFQSLTYPMLDDRTGATRDPAAHIGALLWTRDLNRIGWGALLGYPPGGDGGPAPGRALDLKGLPPAFIGVGDIDLFVEENLAFAARLVEAGVPVELLVAPGAPHGFQALNPDAGVSRRFRLAHINALARALGRPELDAPPPVPPLGGPG